MSNKQLRQLMRALHLIGAVMLGALIYGPWGDGSTLELIIQLVIFPALTVSGLIMWQQPRLAKLRRRSEAR